MKTATTLETPALNSFYLYMTTGCNLACRHCWITPRFVNGQPDPGEYISLDALKRVVAQARPLGLGHVKLTGGEPTLHPQFREIVDVLTAENLGMDMESNGMLITPELAKHLYNHTNVNFVSVSIDGKDAETHDAFRGVKGAWQKALAGADALVDAGYKNVQFIMSVHRGNIEQTQDIIRLAETHNIHSLKFNVVTPTGRGADMHERGEDLTTEMYKDFAHKVFHEFSKQTKVKLILSYPPAMKSMKELWQYGADTIACKVENILGILGSGEIAMCGIGRSIPELVYGHIEKDNVAEIWENHPSLKDLRKVRNDFQNYPEPCASCIFIKRCKTACLANNYCQYGHFIEPNILCKQAYDNGEFKDAWKRNYVDLPEY